MKIIIMILVFLLFIASASADSNFMMLGSENYQLKVSGGVAYYHDHRQHLYDIGYQPGATDAVGIYLQTPVASLYGIDICFGGVSPLGYVDRTRPEFSLDKLIYKNVEVGVYWAASPYNAYGAMIGWRF